MVFPPKDMRYCGTEKIPNSLTQRNRGRTGSDEMRMANRCTKMTSPSFNIFAAIFPVDGPVFVFMFRSDIMAIIIREYLYSMILIIWITLDLANSHQFLAVSPCYSHPRYKPLLQYRTSLSPSPLYPSTQFSNEIDLCNWEGFLW